MRKSLRRVGVFIAVGAQGKKSPAGTQARVQPAAASRGADSKNLPLDFASSGRYSLQCAMNRRGAWSVFSAVGSVGGSAGAAGGRLTHG